MKMCDISILATLVEQAGLTSANDYLHHLMQCQTLRRVSNSMEEDKADIGLDLCNLKDILDEGQHKCDGSDADVYAQLAQKEKDLILAAELGKALLTKNQEMVFKYEQQAEEYNHKVEVSALLLFSKISVI